MENQQEIISITKTIKEVGIDFKLIEALWRSNERERIGKVLWVIS